MYKRILVPVDGSPASTLGLREALRFARNQRAKLRVIHIVDEAALAEYPEAMVGTADLMKAMIADGRKTLDKAMKLAKQSRIKAECVLYEKLLEPLDELVLKEAKKWRADIIVMGTHGYRGVKHFFLGSNAENIARASLLPVLLIHGAQGAKRKRVTRR